MRTVSASEARQTLPAQLDRVEAGEEVEITRHGRVVAVLVRPETLVARRAHDASIHVAQLRERVERARARPFSPVEVSPSRVDELIDDIRAGRSAR